MHNLPPPHPDAILHSQRLTATIITAIEQAGGIIPFNEFMRLALYAPGLGYYSAGMRKFGTDGDFVTAPEISPLFAQCIARQCQQVLTNFDAGVILELGAGSGIMAVDILKTLQELNSLPKRYFILEVSADLQQQQREMLQTKAPQFLPLVEWLHELPTEPLQGIILANEVLDAMPVQKFHIKQDDITEFNITHDSDSFVWHEQTTTDTALQEAVTALDLPDDYISEINLALPAWLQSIADILAEGMILLIDYGFPSNEFYHPQRNQGTLMCHYRHHSHIDPLILVGLQDITAHVDFTTVAEAASLAELQVAGYTNQANFLLGCGLADILFSLNPDDKQNYLPHAQQAKTLILPSEMGELFKVMALTKNFDMPLLGFSQDERVRL
ncbi:SAM-dependent methyltransferase [Candidatus Halobeggiatoa sp. HSG11]|nr:SAM-dependent methyltransferase [Candidatus Halobeggiatoa sp. HSG11]